MRVARGWCELIRRHPRQLVLFSIVAGLLLGPISPAAVIVAALLAAALAGRVPLALAALVAVLAGGALAQARVAALGPGRLPELAGRQIAGRAILLEPIRRWRSGTAVARVRLAEGASAGGIDFGGEVAVVRAERGRPPPGARVGAELRVHGTVAPLAGFEDYQRRRGAHAALELGSWTATGRARGGLAGALDAARERATRGLGAGLHAPEAALLRGMVLGQDEAIAEATKSDFQRSGLAHLLSVREAAGTASALAPRRRPPTPPQRRTTRRRREEDDRPNGKGRRDSALTEPAEEVREGGCMKRQTTQLGYGAPSRLRAGGEHTAQFRHPTAGLRGNCECAAAPQDGMPGNGRAMEKQERISR